MVNKQNPGGMENMGGEACMAVRRNIHRLPDLGMTISRPGANSAWVGDDINKTSPVSHKEHGQSALGGSAYSHAATDYEPPAWLAVDAPSMAVDGEQVWAWVLWLTLTALTFACLFKALVWSFGTP